MHIMKSPRQLPPSASTVYQMHFVVHTHTVTIATYGYHSGYNMYIWQHRALNGIHYLATKSILSLELIHGFGRCMHMAVHTFFKQVLLQYSVECC